MGYFFTGVGTAAANIRMMGILMADIRNQNKHFLRMAGWNMDPPKGYAAFNATQDVADVEHPSGRPTYAVGTVRSNIGSSNPIHSPPFS